MKHLVRIGVWILLLAMGSCRNPGTESDQIRILALKGPSSMAMVTLMDSLKQVGDETVQIDLFEEPMQIRARMLVDKPEMAVLPLNMAAILYNKGLTYQLLAVPVWGTLYLFGSDPLPGGWEGLRGKRVYLMGKGATPDILFRYLLQKNGLSPDDDVRLDYSYPTHVDLANAVLAGQAPLAVLSEPQASLVQEKKPGILQLMDLNREWALAVPDSPGLPQTGILVRSDYARDHADRVMQVGTAWKRSTEWVNSHPGLAAKRIVFYQILPDSSTAVRSISRSNLDFRYAHEIKQSVDRFLEVLFTFNPDAIGGQMPDEKFVFTQPVN